MASASGKPAPNADVILNKINLALARSQQLMSTWLPPDTSKDSRAGSNGDPAMELSEDSIDKIWGNEDQDDKDLFAVKPELLGVGAELPIRSKNPINDVSSGRPIGLRKLSEPLRKQLLGREASRLKEAYAQRATTRGKPTHDHNSVSKPSENKEEDDDEPSRTTVFSKPKKAQRFDDRLSKKQARKEGKKQKREEQRRQRQQQDQKRNTDPNFVYSDSKVGAKNAPRKRNSWSPAEPATVDVRQSSLPEASNSGGSTSGNIDTSVADSRESSLKAPHGSDAQQSTPASSLLATITDAPAEPGDFPFTSSQTIRDEIRAVKKAANKAAKITAHETRVQRLRHENMVQKQTRRSAIEARNVIKKQLHEEQERRALARLQGKKLSSEHLTAITKAYANARAGRTNVTDKKMKRQNREKQKAGKAAKAKAKAVAKNGDVAMGNDNGIGAGADQASGNTGHTLKVDSSDRMEMDLDPNPRT